MTEGLVGRQIECVFAQRWEKKATEVLPVNETVLSSFFTNSHKTDKQTNRQTDRDTDRHAHPSGPYPNMTVEFGLSVEGHAGVTIRRDGSVRVRESPSSHLALRHVNKGTRAHAVFYYYYHCSKCMHRPSPSLFFHFHVLCAQLNY